jgi:activator of 2-hydroxyglutaryl-CoA dehydratase
VVKALKKKLGIKTEVSPYAQVTGAIGAAFLAASL